MSSPFDVHALVGRTFGSVFDDIAPGWSLWGFGDGGRFAAPIASDYYSDEERQADIETRRRFAWIRAALRDGTVVLVDAEGRVIPLRVWFSGRWGFFRDEERGVECLKEHDDTHRMVAEYYSPKFIRPSARKPIRSGKRAGGNTRYNDTEVVELAKAAFAKMSKKSKLRASETVIDRLIDEGRPVVGASRGAWIERVRRGF